MEKLSMLKIKELFRLAIEMNLSARQIAQSLNVSHTVINRYLKRFHKSNISYESLTKLGDKEIVSALYGLENRPSKRAVPDWDYIHREMKRKAMTLELLHEEYVQANPNSSLIITSQLPIQEWHSHLHNPTIADAILDRIVHNAYKIELQGESQRKLKSKKKEEVDA